MREVTLFFLLLIPALGLSQSKILARILENEVLKMGNFSGNLNTLRQYSIILFPQVN